MLVVAFKRVTGWLACLAAGGATAMSDVRDFVAEG
jgi:hypothetical protein